MKCSSLWALCSLFWGCAGDASDVLPSASWQQQFLSAAEGVDRLVVISRHPSAPPAEIRGGPAIAELIRLMEVSEGKSWVDHNREKSDYALEFYRGPEKRITLDYDRRSTLHWEGGAWTGGAILRNDAVLRIDDWFAAHGYDAFVNARLASEEAQRRRREEETRFYGCFPPASRRLFEPTPAAVLSEGAEERARGLDLAKEIGDPVHVAVSCCRALGPVEMPWNQGIYEYSVVIAAFRGVSGSDFAKGLEILKDDRDGLRGAARFVFWEMRPRAFPEEARSRWIARIAEAVLSCAEDPNHDLVFRYLAGRRDPAVRELLQEVGAGRVGRENPRTPGRYDEPRLRAGAYLALARLGDETIKGVVESMLSAMENVCDRAALEVSLALLGEPAFLKKEHFTIHSYSIGLGALEAIERFKGGHGLDILVEAGLDHPWSGVKNEAVLVAERITGQKFYKDKHYHANHYANDVRAWWKEHGAEFVKQCRGAK